MAKSAKSIRKFENVKRSDRFSMNPFEIVVNDVNPREQYGEEEMEELMNQIETDGVKVDLEVKVNRDDQIELTHGFRRMKAIHRLKEERGVVILSVPINCSPEHEENELSNHIILNGGKPMTDYEIGKVLHKYQELTGATAQEAGKRHGIEYQKATRLISLFNEASEELLKKVASGEVAINTAVKITKGKTKEEQNKVVEQIVKSKAENKATGKRSVRMSDITPTSTKPKALSVADALGKLNELKSVDNADLATISVIQSFLTALQNGEDVTDMIKVSVTA